MKEDIYAELADHYKSGLYGLTLQGLEPEAIETFKEALKQFFTPDEAALAGKLMFTPEIITDFCKMAGESEQEIYPLLKLMAEKACVMEVEVQGQKAYQLFEWVSMMENFIRRTDKADPY